MPTPHARSQILIGADGIDRLRHKTVLIAGLGGVGGYCAEAVARAGVGHLIILDHDTVSPSNLNRQLLALHSTLGAKKTDVMRARLLDINPGLELTVHDHFLHPSEAADYLAPLAPDILADCIDSIACKAALVAAAQARVPDDLARGTLTGSQYAFFLLAGLAVIALGCALRGVRTSHRA